MTSYDIISFAASFDPKCNLGVQLNMSRIETDNLINWEVVGPAHLRAIEFQRRVSKGDSSVVTSQKANVVC